MKSFLNRVSRCSGDSLRFDATVGAEAEAVAVADVAATDSAVVTVEQVVGGDDERVFGAKEVVIWRRLTLAALSLQSWAGSAESARNGGGDLSTGDGYRCCVGM